MEGAIAESDSVVNLSRPIRVLILEDNETEAKIIRLALDSGGLQTECRRASTKDEFEEALRQFTPDVILIDYFLTDFNGACALKFARTRYFETPAIIVTGGLGDKLAVELLKAGAADYVLKDRLARLPSAVTRALDDEYKRRERISARRELESKLVLLETEHESSPDGILVVDESNSVISRNRRFLEMWRFPDDLRQSKADKPLLDYVITCVQDPAKFIERVLYLYAHPEEKSQEEIDLVDGRIFDRHSSPMFDSQGTYLGRVWFFRDITERRENERKLKLFRSMVDGSNDAVQVVDVESLALLDVNERACIDLGYTREELLQKRVTDFDTKATREILNLISDQLRASRKAVFESLHRRKDGSVFPVEVSVSLIPGNQACSVAVVRDITERKIAEQSLQESEIRFRTLIEDASDPVAIIDRDGTIQYASPATGQMSGFDPSELLGRHFQEYIHPEDAENTAREVISAIEKPERVHNCTSRMRHKDGSWRVAEANIRNRLGIEPIDGLVVTLRDVTARKRSARALEAMSATNAAVVRARNERSLAVEICRIMVDIGGYRMAWIGSPENDEHKSIKVVAQVGDSGDYLRVSNISWADSPLGCGPTGLAVRLGKTQVCRDYGKDIATTDQRAIATECGFIACLAIPLINPKEIFGVLTLYASDPIAFDDDEVKLLEQLAGDLSYGIEAMRERERHAEALERLEKNMESTIQAIATLVGTRDPYTAGHEQRVATLAVAIARELHLDSERIRALRLAAAIHDVGKVRVPTEILVKPGHLDQIEMSLIKTHSQAGYEILRNIDFPWPIAQMVQQHHEKMDGSGYPLGLSGDQILPESRILAVADVMEAMSSHRPYRPGRGLSAALEELQNGRGIQFDAEVVDACVRLFNEKNFQWA